MRSLLRFGILLGPFLLSVPLAGQTVSGLVWDGTTGDPVPGAEVYVLSAEGVRVLRTLVAGPDGRFDLDIQGAQDWLLLAEKPGFVASAPQPVTTPEGQGHDILLELRGLNTAREGFAVTEKAGTASERPRVLGWVVEKDTGRPVREAEVEVVGTGQRVTTDPNGMFVLEDLDPGQVGLLVSHLSFARIGYVFHVQMGKSYEIRAVMTPEAIGIQGIEVTVRSQTWYRQMEGLRFRMSRGLGGEFVVADQLERRGYPPVVETLRAMPGVRVRKADPVNYDVSFRNCKLPPVLYIDGTQVNQTENREPLYDLTTLSTVDVQAIEVYRGAASVPPEFSGPDAMCGAIVIWTKRGG